MAGQPDKTPGAKNSQANQIKASDQAQSSFEDKSFDWHTAIERPEWWLVVVGFITFGVVGWQAILMRCHAKHFEKLARETAKSVAVSQDTAKRQLRAYIVVIIGDAMWQEREKGYRFGALPLLKNSGQTPAYKVTFIAKAAILPTELPKDYKLSEMGDEAGETMVGPGHQMTMHAKVDDFVHDSEVQAIKTGDRDKSLYTWGIIRYEDCFGEPHYTRFCHRVKWLGGDGPVYGYYIPGRNTGD